MNVALFYNEWPSSRDVLIHNRSEARSLSVYMLDTSGSVIP